MIKAIARRVLRKELAHLKLTVEAACNDADRFRDLWLREVRENAALRKELHTYREVEECMTKPGGTD